MCAADRDSPSGSRDPTLTLAIAARRSPIARRPPALSTLPSVRFQSSLVAVRSTVVQLTQTTLFSPNSAVDARPLAVKHTNAVVLHSRSDRFSRCSPLPPPHAANSRGLSPSAQLPCLQPAKTSPLVLRPRFSTSSRLNAANPACITRPHALLLRNGLPSSFKSSSVLSARPPEPSDHLLKTSLPPTFFGPARHPVCQ